MTKIDIVASSTLCDVTPALIVPLILYMVEKEVRQCLGEVLGFFADEIDVPAAGGEAPFGGIFWVRGVGWLRKECDSLAALTVHELVAFAVDLPHSTGWLIVVFDLFIVHVR